MDPMVHFRPYGGADIVKSSVEASVSSAQLDRQLTLDVTNNNLSGLLQLVRESKEFATQYAFKRIWLGKLVTLHRSATLQANPRERE
jgi:hypothetical protein